MSHPQRNNPRCKDHGHRQCGCEGFKLKVASAIRLDDVFPQAQSGITPAGDLFFLSPIFFEAAPEGTPALIIYRNSGASPTELARIDVDPLFPIPGGAAADECLRLFALLELSITSEDPFVGTARIRVFARNAVNALVLVRTISLPDLIDLNGATILLPELFEDRFATLSFVNADGQLVVLVVDVTTGATIARVTPAGAVSSNISTLFCLRGKIYLAIGTQIPPPAPGGRSTFFLEIYRLTHLGPVLVERIQTPNLINDIDIPAHAHGACKVLLAIGTSRALAPGQVSIIPPPPDTLPSLTGESGGARVYWFDGKNLEIAANIPQNIAVIGVSFSPSGRYLAVTLVTANFQIAWDTVLVYRLERGFDHALEEIRTTPIAEKTFCPNLVETEPVPGASFINTFSDNGRWFLATGGYPPTCDPEETNPLPQLVLYRVCAGDERPCH